MNFIQQQERFDAFRRNSTPNVPTKHRHAMPRRRLYPFRQALSRLAGNEYPFHDKEIVTCCGRICMHRKKINLNLARWPKIGIKEVDDGIWLVSFIAYDLGYIDLEEKTLQPLDNPFGTRVLPMS